MYGFRYYFTPLSGVLFNFRSRYYCTIGHQVVLSLTGWSPSIHARFHGTGATRDYCRSALHFIYEAITRYGPTFQRVRLWNAFVTPLRIGSSACRSHDPVYATPTSLHTYGLGYSLFARRYWGSRCFFPFLQVLRWVSSLRYPRHAMDSHTVLGGLPQVVSESQRSPDRRLFAPTRGFSQLNHVFRRLLVPRHPHVHLM